MYKQVREGVVSSLLLYTKHQGLPNSKVFRVSVEKAFSLLEGVVVLKLRDILLYIVSMGSRNQDGLSAEHNRDTDDNDDHHQLHDEGLNGLSTNDREVNGVFWGYSH